MTNLSSALALIMDAIATDSKKVNVVNNVPTKTIKSIAIFIYCD